MINQRDEATIDETQSPLLLLKRTEDSRLRQDPEVRKNVGRIGGIDKRSKEIDEKPKQRNVRCCVHVNLCCIIGCWNPAAGFPKMSSLILPSASLLSPTTLARVTHNSTRPIILILYIMHTYIIVLLHRDTNKYQYQSTVPEKGKRTDVML